MITQIDRQGNVTIFCNGKERMTDYRVSDKRLHDLNATRKTNRKPERDKLRARLLEFGSDIPEELL